MCVFCLQERLCSNKLVSMRIKQLGEISLPERSCSLHATHSATANTLAVFSITPGDAMQVQRRSLHPYAPLLRHPYK